MNQAKRVFTIEFKQECVNLVLNQGYRVMQAAGAMGVGESTLQRWVRQYRKELTGITPQASAITPEQQHIQALEAEIRKLKRDNDLLTKATVRSTGGCNTCIKFIGRGAEVQGFPWALI